KLCYLAGTPYLWDEATYRKRPGRARDGEAINEILGHWTCTQSAAELIELLRSEGIPCSPARKNGMRDLLLAPQGRENELAVPVQLPTKGRIWLPAPAYRIDGERGSVLPAPLLGQHTDEIMREHGYDDEAIAALREQGVIA